MTGITHIVGGLASLWLIAPGLQGQPELIGVAAVTATVGALLPDLDSNTSILQTASVKNIHPAAPFATLVHQYASHRGALHSIRGVGYLTAFLSLPLALVAGWQVGAALALGYASHLLLDMCTVRGLRVLWPSQTVYWALPKACRVITGDPEEGIVFALCGCATLGLLLTAI